MSYDVCFEIETGNGRSAEIADRNYTTNAGPMWRRALGTEGVSRLSDIIRERPKASDLGPIIRRAADAMRAAGQEAYADLEPQNGWGDYAGALEFLEWIAQTCERHPAAVASVSS